MKKEEKVEIKLAKKKHQHYTDYMKVVIYSENVMQKDFDELKKEAMKALKDGDIWYIELISPAKEKVEKDVT